MNKTQHTIHIFMGLYPNYTFLPSLLRQKPLNFTHSTCIKLALDIVAQFTWEPKLEMVC